MCACAGCAACGGVFSARLRRGAPAPGGAAPFALVGPYKNARVLTAVNDAAAALGLKEGQSFADACAIHPKLEWAEAAPEEDTRLLHKLVEWAERYREIWEGRLDRLDTYLKELQTKETKHARQRRRK